VLFAKHEGILPAPEANHAVKGAIEEALKAKAAGTAPVILFNLCGHGHFDMAAYEKFNAGEMVDSEFSDQVAPPPNFRAPHEAPRLPRFSRTV
jgi:tryptophan synthase beta chain